MAPRGLLRLATYMVVGVDLVTGLKLYGFPDCANGPLKDNLVCDTSATPKSRAAALVAALTLEEKFNNTGNTAPGVPRLGIPPYQWWNEALHGVAYEYGGDVFADANDTDQFTHATSFPQPILMGAAFDDDLIKAVAEVVSTESRAFSNAGRFGIDAWTPNVNPFKDPRWGRGQETPGEDPFHIASYVRALLDGLQGGLHPKYKKIIATCKHFVGYDMESWNGNWRYQFDAQISPQDMSEYYTPPFASCARDANVGSFMCAYNAANGVPTCADPYLMQTLLREHWGWTNDDQYVVSDCDAIQNVYLPHMWGSTQEEAAADSLNAGVDLNCGTYYQTYLPLAYEQGLINDTRLDTALTRVYSALVQLGYFDPAASQPYRALNWTDVNTKHAQELALKAAHEGIALLKNADGALPLTLDDSIPIAFIGEWANATTQMQGNYHGTAPFLTSPLMAAQEAGLNVSYANGNGQGDPTTGAWADVWAAADDAEVIVYIGGIDNDVESEGMDRVSIGWSGAQLDLITRLASQGKPTIVVAMGGGQIDSAPLAANPNISAIVWGGYPGQSGGTALLDILTGKVAPAGRIPTTQYPAAYIKELPMTDMTLRPDDKTGSPGRTYMWYNGKPTYPFGWGLHYTTFSSSLSLATNASSSIPISSLTSSCNSTTLDTCAFTPFDVTVTNTGKTSSDYTALLFLRFPSSTGPQPVPNKALIAYNRFHDLAPGESRTETIAVDLGRLARADEEGDKRVWPGSYTVEIGVDGEELDGNAEVSFELTGDDEGLVVEEWPRMSDEGRTGKGVPGLEGYFVGGY
ncbi:putative xylan 1,4-beta-Xylosidase [Phyllosticta capitalensis]|uniref:putative xylan 1,4-beta-Xylosidase n=1 Tax=Phyllosticta capitalensis TaxID=121624 RepID=UPI00312D5612